MKIIIEGTVNEMPDIAKNLQHQALDKNTQNVKYISEDDLRKTVTILSNYFKKYSKVRVFGYMPDTELSTFIERTLSK